MVSREEHGKDGIKRKADDECLTTFGKIPKIEIQERKFATSSLLEELSRGAKVDLDSFDGIPGGRTRTTSEHVPVALDLLEAADKNRSLPSTPTFSGKLRKRHFSLSDLSLSRHRSLLGSFAESALNGRLEPVKTLEGFTLQLVASGASFTSTHTTLPVTVNFFDLNTTGCAYFPSAPVPYLGKCDLEDYRIPPKGTIQATLFNPQKTVVKMFLTNYDVEDMPPHSKTFVRHVWQWKVEKGQDESKTTTGSSSSAKNLQHLIHFRLLSDRKSRIYLHTDIRILFAQDAARDALLLPVMNSNSTYQLCDHIDMPSNPRYSSSK